jgi:predicted HD phosphohydrolase
VFELRNVDELSTVLRTGAQHTDGEPLDMLAHALQCAALLADEAPGDLELQVSGLVHDLGSLIQPGRASTHATTGANAVRRLLGARVADLVAGHDTAKRYLVTVDSTYRNVLTPQSRATLRAQGGLMDPSERAAFEHDRDFHALVVLRRADDSAKKPSIAVPNLDAWRDHLESLALSHAG